MAHIEDRWTVPGPTGRRVKSPRWGTGKRWLAVFETRDGRRKKSFDTRDAAVQHLARIDVDQRAGVAVGSRVTLAEYGDQWLAAQIHQRASTRGHVAGVWKNHIRPELGDLLLTEIVRADVQRAVIAWTKKLGPTAVATTRAHLSSIMRSAIADRIITTNPCASVRLPRDEHTRIVPLTVAQVHAIAERIHPHYKALVLLGAATGLRSGELRGLTVDRLQFDGDRLRIRVDRQLLSHVPTWGPPKTPTSDRTVIVGADSATALRDHLARWPPGPHGLVFTGLGGKALSRSAVARAWNAAAAGMDVRPRSGLHDLRHFHASMLIAGGLSVIAVADRLGHKDATETLNTYSHLWPDDETKAITAVEVTLWHTPGVGQEPETPTLRIVGREA